MVIAREHLHRLVDALPEDATEAAERLLRQLADDSLFSFLMAAPEDDEPETEEERAAVAEARAASARGEVITTEELRRQLGL